MKTNYILKNQFVIIFMINLMFVNCEKINSEDDLIEFELLNKELSSLNNDSLFYGRRYNNENEILLASNILKYRLTNKTNKRLLFIINSEDLFRQRLIDFNIHDSLNNLKSLSHPLVNFNELSIPYLNFERDQDSIKTSHYLRLGIKEKHIKDYISYVNHSFILNLGESKSFQSLITLPILREQNSLTHTNPLYFKNLENGDRLFLTYEMNFNDYKDVLQDWQIEELRKNNVEFFEGTLTSNSVPIKLINLKY
ncbi:MAG: hypothetical protein Q8K02_08525 [Flavobacterium sp.]|nr:hypothetical protein [Flavobacterium sp.]